MLKKIVKKEIVLPPIQALGNNIVNTEHAEKLLND